MIDAAALAHVGSTWGLAGADLSEVLDPWRIVLTRRADGGAAPDALARMTAELHDSATDLITRAHAKLAAFDRAETALLDAARVLAGEKRRVL
jgi:argininosuccinate lyase